MRVPGLVIRRPDAGEDPNGTPASRPGIPGKCLESRPAGQVGIHDEMSRMAVDDGDESSKLISLR